MLYQNKHQGVAVPMVTPFNQSGHVDMESAEKIITRFMESGIGVFVLGTTGETASIPHSERSRLVERTVGLAGRDIPVYAGIGDNCMANSIEAGRQYLKLGADAVVAHLPSYYPLNPDEMHDYFKLLHDSIDGPIMLYNIPQTTSMSLPMDLVESLAALPHFVGFKDSERDERRITEAAARIGNRDDFSLFMGSAILSIEALKEGFQGLVPGSGNLIPGDWAKLFKLAMDQDWQGAEALQERQNQVASIFQNNCSLGQSLATLKAMMYACDICEPFVLPPLRTLPESEQVKLAAQLHSLGLVK